MEVQKIAKWLVLLVLLPILVIVQIVEYMGKHPAPPTPEQISAQNAVQKAASETFNQQYQAINDALKKKTYLQLYSMVLDCKIKVLAFASENQKEKFGVFIPDEYSADVYQAGVHLSGGKILSDKERSEMLTKELATGTDRINVLKRVTRFTVIHTVDSFNGTLKKPIVYNCDVGNDLAVIPQKAD